MGAPEMRSQRSGPPLQGRISIAFLPGSGKIHRFAGAFF